jgi:serine/threonine protein kinase
MINTILNQRYRVREQLSKQPGRRTFLAIDLESENLVAIKILLLDRDFAWEKLKLFEREAKTLKNLNHPAIPQYIDYFEIDLPDYQGFALVQEYIDAPSLETHIENGRNFSEADLKEIAGSILEILIYLHRLQPAIIHRDIKPSNILLSNDRSGNSIGEIFLIDFGSVQNSAAIDRGTITIVGTYGYMPPEQFGGRTVPASDLYGLGATLIYLATGQNPADLPQKNLQVRLDKITNLNPAFQAWLNKAMETDLEKRFSSAEKALDFLDNSAIELTPSDLASSSHSRIVLTETLNEIKVKVFSSINLRQYEKNRKSSPRWNKIITTYLTAFPAILKFIPRLGYYASFILFGVVIIPLSLIVFSNLDVTEAVFKYYLIFSCISLIIFVCASILQKINNYLLTKYTVKELAIDNKTIAFSEIILGEILDSLPPSSVESITKVQVVHTVNYNPYKNLKKSRRSSVGIWAGEVNYELNLLTSDEAEWLGTELSNWLQVPIKYRQITIR